MFASLCIHLLALCCSTATAFVAPSLVLRSSTPSNVLVLRDSMRETGNSKEEVEAARQAFERLALDDSTGTLRPGPLPMTANVQRLRSMELTLLETLRDSDQAIDPLVELWVKERRNAAEALFAMIQMAPHQHDLEKEEEMLREMMDDYGADGWVEPHGRLAVLLFMKGRYVEVLDLCDYVLYHKPWHFEVAQLMGVTFLRLGDFGSALRVTRDCVLPPMRHAKRRKQWVDRMTGIARERLQFAESVTKTAFIEASVAKTETAEDECPVDQGCWE